MRGSTCRTGQRPSGNGPCLVPPVPTEKSLRNTKRSGSSTICADRHFYWAAQTILVLINTVTQKNRINSDTIALSVLWQKKQTYKAYIAQWNVSEICIDHKIVCFFSRNCCNYCSRWTCKWSVWFFRRLCSTKSLRNFLCIKLCPLLTNKNDHPLLVHDLTNAAWRCYIPLKNDHIIKVSVWV